MANPLVQVRSASIVADATEIRFSSAPVQEKTPTSLSARFDLRLHGSGLDRGRLRGA
jgi:hypothetical protein